MGMMDSMLAVIWHWVRESKVWKQPPILQRTIDVHSDEWDINESQPPVLVFQLNKLAYNYVVKASLGSAMTFA
jgi:hypothetical protein